MIKNYVKEYLDNNTLDQLKDEYGISYSEYNGMVIFSYSQIDSPKSNPIVRMCRGLVLEKDTWNIINYPFNRFYNFEEMPEEREKFDWKNAVSTTKIDGSLFSCFKYKNNWYISTRSQIGGMNNLSDNIHSYGWLFEEAIKPFTRDEFFAELERYCNGNRYCFTFEIVSPYNIIVSPYSETKLYLIGCRCLETGNEAPFALVNAMMSEKFQNIIKVPNVIPLTDENGEFRGFDEMKKIAEAGAATDEGFVVTDFSQWFEGNFPRTKVKNSAYVALHHLRGTIENGSMNYANIMSIVYKGETDEVCASLPHYEKYMREVEVKWNKFIHRFNDVINADSMTSFWNMTFEDRKLPENKKAFAIVVMKNKEYSSFLFMMFNQKFSSLRECIDEMSKKKSYDSIMKSLWENFVSKEIND